MRVFVFAGEVGGTAPPVSLEMLAKARTLGDPEVFYVGPGSDEAFAALGDHGATRVHHLDPGENLPAAGAALAMADLLGEGDLALFGLSPTDRDTAGRVAATAGVPVLSNAVEVSAGDDVRVVNEILGGTTLVETAFTGAGPHLVVVRPKSFTAEAVGGGEPEVLEVPLPEAGRSGSAVVTARHEEESSGPSLAEADIIVSGGRGMGGEEHFALLEEVAGLLGGAVGATRAVVDSGWVPYSMQIGQTGKTVKPTVYIACGISGAMQHLVGMKDSGTIIAINKDEEAPIFGVADLGIVGDVHAVLPRLLESLQGRG